MRRLTMMLTVLLASCGEFPPPPGNMSIDGLPLAGDLPFAHRAGFTRCFEFNVNVRCRRDGVSFMGEGPFNAAVDAGGPDGRSGFAQLTLWSRFDQRAASRVGERLRKLGWRLCRTGTADRGDQNIWRKAGAAVRFSIDVSYWGKRRLRVLPERGQATGTCL